MTTQAGGELPRRMLARLAKWASRFRADRQGAVAVEFSLVAIPFLALLFAIFQTMLVLFAGQTLDTALQDSTRLILTGQAQTMSAANFATGPNGLCSRVAALFNCTAAYNAGTLQIDIRTPSSFANAVLTPPTISGNTLNWGTPNGQPLYSNPGPGQIVVVRAALLQPVYMSFPATFLGSNWDSGLKSAGSSTSHLLLSTVAFVTEPF
ncbi:MAG: TadE/TadG family type IV pilus assembly protein [Beijerinckiaceae bacterium]|jgi:Flp pilus assembly protein TadG